MKIFYVHCCQTTIWSQLDEDDQKRQPQGVYQYEAKDEDGALDQFHNEIPISCLDDYQIEVRETP